MSDSFVVILKEDKVFFPSNDCWDSTYSSIMENNNITGTPSEGDYLFLEIYPPEHNTFRNNKTNKRLKINNKWEVIIHGTKIPDWYKNNKSNQKKRVLKEANKWFQKLADNVIPGYHKIGGSFSTITGGDSSCLIGKNCSKISSEDSSILVSRYNSVLTAECDSILVSEDSSVLTGDHNCTLKAGRSSILTSGDNSILISGKESVLTAGDNSILTSYEGSIFCAGKDSSFILHWHDGERMRTIVAYVGEKGIKPNTKYLGKYSGFTEVKE